MTATVRGISVDGRSGTFDADNLREYSLIYKVKTDDFDDGPASVRDAVGIPSLGSIYSPGNDFDNSAVVVSKTATQTDSPLEWEVEVTFSTEVDEDPTQQEENPLQQLAEISYGFQSRRIMVPGYFNSPEAPPTDGKLQLGIIATNGELFDPPPEMDLAEPVLTITRNFASISGAGLMALANTVNSDNFQGATPRQLRLGAPQATRQWHKTVGFYWRVQYSMAFRWETHDIQILNQGSYYWDGARPSDYISSTTFQQDIVNGVPRIVNLTTDGQKNTDANDPKFVRLRVYREIPFNSLGLI